MASEHLLPNWKLSLWVARALRSTWTPEPDAHRFGQFCIVGVCNCVYIYTYVWVTHSDLTVT